MHHFTWPGRPTELGIETKSIKNKFLLTLNFNSSKVLFLWCWCWGGGGGLFQIFQFEMISKKRGKCYLSRKKTMELETYFP